MSASRRRFTAAALAVAALLLFAVPAASHTGTGGFGPGRGRPFASTSAWNTPIGATVTVDPNSAAMVANLSAVVDGKYRSANIYEFGIPIYTGDPTFGTRTVDCTAPSSWGTCTLETAGQIPLNANVVPHPGSDGAAEVIDYGTGRAYGFWQYRWNNGAPTTSWGGVDADVYNGDGRGSGATGAGVSRLAGVARIHELQAGVIDHALVFATQFCAGGSPAPFRYPATKTDGKYTGTGAVPEGVRVQLDPAVNVDAIPNITPFEKIVARALQRYGAYNIDCSGNPMAFSFERPQAGQVDPYAALGATYDYYRMPNIPWNRLRVLAAWDSSTG